MGSYCVMLVKNQAKQKGEEIKESNNAGTTRFWLVQVLHFLIRDVSHTGFSNHANICCSLSAVFARTGLAFSDVGAHSATAVMLTFCSPSCEVSPRKFFTKFIHEHSETYAGSENVLVNSPSMNAMPKITSGGFTLDWFGGFFKP